MVFSSGKKTSNFIGAYFSLERVVLTEADADGKKLRIVASADVPLPSRGVETLTIRSSALNAAFFENPDVWVVPLRKAIAGAKFSAKEVIVSLSPSFSVIRHFTMPAIDRRYWARSIPFEAKKYVPFSLEDSVYDYQVYKFKSEQTGASMLGVVFVLASKKSCAVLSDAFRSAGLQLAGIEVSALSAQRFFDLAFTDKRTGPNSFYAHFEEASGYLLFLRENRPVLFRTINFGEGQMTERRRLEAANSIDFINKQFGGAVYKEALLSGENLELWKTILQDDSRLPVRMWDPSKILGVGSAGWGAYSSVGAALKRVKQDSDGIDLRADAKKDKLDAKASSIMWILVLLFSSYFVISSAVVQAKLFALNMRTKHSAHSAPAIKELRGMSALQIQQVLATVSARKTFINSITKNYDFAVLKLNALVETIPNKAWITSVSYSVSADKSGYSASVFNFAGSVKTSNPKSDSAVINDFRDAFRRHPVISSAYIDTGGKADMIYDIARGLVRSESDSTFSVSCATGDRQ